MAMGMQFIHSGYGSYGSTLVVCITAPKQQQQLVPAGGAAFFPCKLQAHKGS